MKYILLFAVILFSNNSFSGSYDLTYFKNRFEIAANADGEKIIVDKVLLEGTTMEDYLRNLSTYLTVSDNDLEMQIPTCKGAQYEKPNLEIRKTYAKAFEWMKKTNLGKMLVEPKFLKFIREVETITNSFTHKPDFPVVANLNNPNYFYKKTFIKLLQDQLTKLAKAYFTGTIYLKPVTYIVDDYSNFIVQKKLYHQNILAYYLEAIPAEELGLTNSEARKALSSIIDSRLSFFGGFLESRKIAKDFEGYGYNRLLANDKASEDRWAKYEKIFDERIYKINYAFSDAFYSSSPITINLSIKKDKIENGPSFTFDDECPNFLYEQRKIYEFVRVALGMSPIRYSGKLFTLIRSKYQPQALSEAMYYAYLESTNQTEKAAVLLKQSMNPLLK